MISFSVPLECDLELQVSRHGSDVPSGHGIGWILEWQRVRRHRGEAVAAACPEPALTATLGCWRARTLASSTGRSPLALMWSPPSDRTDRAPCHISLLPPVRGDVNDPNGSFSTPRRRLPERSSVFPCRPLRSEQDLLAVLFSRHPLGSEVTPDSCTCGVLAAGERQVARGRGPVHAVVTEKQGQFSDLVTHSRQVVVPDLPLPASSRRQASSLISPAVASAQ